MSENVTVVLTLEKWQRLGNLAEGGYKSLINEIQGQINTQMQQICQTAAATTYFKTEGGEISSNE